MTSELDLDDAIASILADSDEDTSVKKKKASPKKKNSKLLSSKALTSSVNDEEFYQNLSKIAEEQNVDNEKNNVKLSEEDAKKMASSLAALDDLDSDLLGTLGKKSKVTSPQNKPSKDHDVHEKHHETKRKTSTGSLHRKGSVTPFKSDDEIDVLDNNLMLSEDDDDVLNSSMNSSTSKHRKVSPNKISPRVSLDDMGEDTKTKKVESTKMSKDIDFDSDSDLPGLEKSEAKVAKKKSARSRRVKKRDDGDLFGEDDDLPNLDAPATKSESSKPKASSALDSLLGKKNKSSDEAKKTKPASLDDFMAKVSTTNKPSPKSELQSPVRSPTSEDTFQFGGYAPSAAVTGRRSRGGTRPDSTSEFGRRSVKFSDDLGLDHDLLSPKKRPSTAPGGRRNKQEAVDPLNNTFSATSNKGKADWLGIGEETDVGSSGAAVGKDEDLSPQFSLEGSKSSTSADWLGLGDDVTDDHLNASLSPDAKENEVKVPEDDFAASLLPGRNVTTTQDEELTKMLDAATDGSKNKAESDDKALFPWEEARSPAGRRRRPATASSVKQPDASTTKVSSENAREVKDSISSAAHSLPSGEDETPQVPQVHDRRDPSHVIPGYNERHSEPKQNYGVELKGMMGKFQDTENEKHKVEVEMANTVAELETKIRRLEIENDGLEQGLELSKQRNREDAEALETSHRNRVQSLEESYQRREARQREENELLVARHKDAASQVEREKSELQSAHARKISALESSKLAEIERLNDLHRRALHEVRSEHLAEINHLKKMKDQEISATMTAYSHTKSLQNLMEEVLNSTKQVQDLHHIVEVSHKNIDQERDITMQSKDEYLKQLQDRLLRQQTENTEERTRLHNLLAKMEVQLREQSRKFEEDKWKLSQEDSRLKSLRVSLEEERRITREQLEAERGLLERSKEQFLSQQREMMTEVNNERRTLALERAELSAAQKGIMNKEKQKHENFTKLDAEQEIARVRLAEDTAALNAREAQLKRDQEELRREKRAFMDKEENWSTEKEHIGKLGLELEKRAREIDELSLEAAKVREEGTKSLEIAQRMQVAISQQADELEARVLLVQERERHIADERLASVKEKRELEMERRRGLCSRCSQSQTTPVFTPLQASGSTPNREASARRSMSSEPSLSVNSSPRASSVHDLPPDVVVNTLDLRRTLRRWSQDREQDEEFLAKESEFLSSLHDSHEAQFTSIHHG